MIRGRKQQKFLLTLNFEFAVDRKLRIAILQFQLCKKHQSETSIKRTFFGLIGECTVPHLYLGKFKLSI